MLTVFLDILKSEEITACMVEYTIKDHTDAFFMAGFYKIGEIFIGSETGIQFFVIGCLVAMSDTFKKRPIYKAVHPISLMWLIHGSSVFSRCTGVP